MEYIKNSLQQTLQFKKSKIDIIEIDIKEGWRLLGEIIGETYDEELLDNMFSKFCLGK